MQVNLFIPCLVDQFHPQVGLNAVRVLERLGVDVFYPEDQICCGQPFFKAGYWQKTIPLAKNIIRAFGYGGLVVAPSGSCVNMIRNYYPRLFRYDALWQRRALELSKRVYEFSEFLVHKAGITETGSSFKGKVTYHDSCQVLRGLGISLEPRRLLESVSGLEFVEMEKSEVCCGFGGIFSFKYPHIAGAMAEEKIENILKTGAEAVVGCEISCLMHIGRHLKSKGIPIRPLHLADVLV